MKKEAYIFALGYGRLEIVEYLIEKRGIIMNEILDEANGENALHIACAEGHLDIVKYLIEKKGMEINFVQHDEHFGYNALIFATKYEHFDVVEYLINNKIDIHHKDSKEYNAFNHAFNHAYSYSSDKLSEQNIKELLIEKGIAKNEAKQNEFNLDFSYISHKVFCLNIFKNKVNETKLNFGIFE